jgi:cell division protein FtsI (penicillin-binding protein 3)
VLFLVTGALLVAVVARVGYLQTVDRRSLAAEGEQQRLSNVTLPADRGAIFDRNGFELALSVPQTTIWADPRAIQGAGPTAAALANALQFSPAQTADLQKRLSTTAEFEYVARQVDDATAKRVADLQLPGVYSYSESKRFYPAGTLARGLLGITDIDGKGTGGLEQAYDKMLTGKPGELIRERDEQGRTIPSGRDQTIPAQPGNDVVLTIDKTLQFTTEDLLMQQVASLHAKGAMAVVMDTASGDILAMASVDRDRMTGSVNVSSANRVVTDTYEPGSVGKIVPSSAVLDLGESSPDQFWNIAGSHKSYEYVIEDAEAHGSINLTTTQVITESSNIGALMMAERIGPQAFDHYLRAFGFGQPSALALPHESPGILTPVAKWSGPQLDTMAFGQGIGVTGIQLVSAMNAIANGGVYVAPRLIDATIDQNGHRHSTPPSSKHSVIKPKTAQEMNQILQTVWCKGGTAQSAPRVGGYTVAGKTGTGYVAQNAGYHVVGPDGRLGIDGYRDAGGAYHYFASFAGFVPAQDPKLTILVSIDEPPAGGPHFGGLVAAPVFSSIAQEALQQLQIPPIAGTSSCPRTPSG